jgi:hypothetical protein
MTTAAATATIETATPSLRIEFFTLSFSPSSPSSKHGES